VFAIVWFVTVPADKTFSLPAVREEARSGRVELAERALFTGRVARTRRRKRLSVDAVDGRFRTDDAVIGRLNFAATK
jgi:hypothetical protein